jgi:hypothetical protein
MEKTKKKAPTTKTFCKFVTTCAIIRFVATCVILRFVAAGVILKLNYENKQFESDQLFTDTVQEVVSERYFPTTTTTLVQTLITATVRKFGR